ncbi:hypothetical protein [Streptomyces capitiformicae]|uniref:Uncharacterized protein n=1 Tax=Streptomyces capitiformicae TaxID=2014920 RepID=A0A918ZHS0_9ACTN|nr:hypothetical protein [Streptomyces capitiformicae]GHE52165.1 hypothetical protein GCM10017771_74420 [Streptomyces capitiformicae]
MITTEPIGDWTWEITPDTAEAKASRAAEIAVAVWNILARYELAVSVGKVDLSVRAMHGTRDVRLDVRGLALEADPLAPGTALSDAVARAESFEGDLLTGLRVQCPGVWLESGGRHRAEQLFTVQVDIWKSDLVVVTLETYSDAWLTMDTREREQPMIHAENAPRLSAALQAVSDLLGGAPEPGDPNRHATPTTTGFEDLTVEGPAYADSWGTFGVPTRSRRLLSPLPRTENEYEDTTDHPVRYFTVQRDGRTLGYVWASTGDNAAGYEPRTAAGDDAFEVGAGWVLRLREAHGRKLDALEALDWLRQAPPRPDLGRLSEERARETPSLDALEELSGRY